MNEIIFRFVMGGLLITIISEVAHKSPKAGGFLSVLPIMSMIVMTITLVNDGIENAQKQAFGAIVGSVVTLVIYYTLWKLLDFDIMSKHTCTTTGICVSVEPYDVFDDYMEEDVCPTKVISSYILRPKGDKHIYGHGFIQCNNFKMLYGQTFQTIWGRSPPIGSI